MISYTRSLKLFVSCQKTSVAKFKFYFTMPRQMLPFLLIVLLLPPVLILSVVQFQTALWADMNDAAAAYTTSKGGSDLASICPDCANPLFSSDAIKNWRAILML